MKIIHSSDFHIKEEGDNRWKALEQVVEIANSEQVDALVISGDLFDSNVNAETLRVAIREVFNLSNAHVYIIPGNHDISSYSKGFYFGDNTHLLSNQDWSENVVEFDDFILIGIPFEEIDLYEFKSRLKQIHEINSNNKPIVLLYHGELLDVSFDRGDFGPEAGRYMPSRLSIFEEVGIEYVLAGHFHQNFKILKMRENGFFIYPGSPVSITQKEVGPRSIALIQENNPPRQVSLETFHFLNIDVPLNAFDGGDPIAIINKELDKANSNSQILLTVSGTIVGSEEELINKIDTLINQKNCEVIKREFLFRDVSQVTTHPVFQLVDEILLEKYRKTINGDDDLNGITTPDDELIRETIIQAMVKAGL